MKDYRNKRFITADDVAEDFGCSKGKAYELIHDMNQELKDRGFLTVCGRVSTKYYCEKVYTFVSAAASIENKEIE